MFDREHIGLSKGSISMVLTVNRKMMSMPLPIDPQHFETAKQGQVKGLGGGSVKKILKEHGQSRILSEEGGRTSRGNMERMRAYVAGINSLFESGHLDLKGAEDFWVGRANAYFDAMPFSLKLDPSKSLRACLRHLFSQAADRQREVSGTMYVGAMMQHLVGAKLRILLGSLVVPHGFSVADGPTNRSSDFLLGDVAIHVTTTPGEALLRKCKGNLSSGLRPLIITSEDGVGGARAFAKQTGVEERIDVIEIEQFLAANLYEHSKFSRDSRVATVGSLVEAYNDMVAECETDPSLRIELDA